LSFFKSLDTLHDILADANCIHNTFILQCMTALSTPISCRSWYVRTAVAASPLGRLEDDAFRFHTVVVCRTAC
jgi:hypothetical protein